MFSRKVHRSDGPQAEIVKALRKCGVAIEIIGRPLDLLGCHRGQTFLAEVKEEDGKLNKSQAEFISRWPGKVYLWRSVEQALKDVIGG